MLQKPSYGWIYILPLLWLIVLLSIDLWTKYLLYNLEWYQESYRFEPVMNMWISFSWQVPYGVVIPLSLIAIWGFIYLYQHKSFSPTITLLLIAGTLWNLYDRIVYGGVRDFLVMPWLFIFNIADIFLTLGFTLALIYVYNQKKK
jgi:lipoprotein signal peptidase